jgi:hypothetical protein
MDSIFVHNPCYSELLVILVGADNGKASITVPAGSDGLFRSCPKQDYALLVFTTGRDKSLYGLYNVRPSMMRLTLHRNQPEEAYKRSASKQIKGPDASYSTMQKPRAKRRSPR